MIAELMRVIDSRADDPRLQWSPDRATVRIFYSRLVQDGQPRVDHQGHRVRFADAWRAAMAEHGWQPAGLPDLFTRA
jgi:hypothetical protein